MLTGRHRSSSFTYYNPVVVFPLCRSDSNGDYSAGNLRIWIRKWVFIRECVTVTSTCVHKCAREYTRIYAPVYPLLFALRFMQIVRCVYFTFFIRPCQPLAFVCPVARWVVIPTISCLHNPALTPRRLSDRPPLSVIGIRVLSCLHSSFPNELFVLSFPRIPRVILLLLFRIVW